VVSVVGFGWEMVTSGCRDLWNDNKER
jgi:hypothetical protein